ncbi:MAG: MBOAT family O-acyltransferase, partial [Planctomycetota bacterium]
MIFTEFRFLGFFLLVFAIHWSLRGARTRKTWLLLTSYAFYAAWDWRFLGLILASTLVDFVTGLRIAASEDPGTRKWWLRLSLCANLGILGFFKYCDFFLSSTASLVQAMGFEANLPVLELILPVGISFFTFQTMSYSLDIYYRRLEPTRSLLDLSLFVGFFPQLVAGPIVRAKDFLPQLERPQPFAAIAVKPALLLFLSGFIKKAVISDNLAPMVDAYFADPSAWSAGAAWIAVPGYAVQIYCDFSGYSDMAIALAALLGYRLCLNFHGPYLASDIRDFWRRWHISLSTWLRDYLYIPLGGS